MNRREMLKAAVCLPVVLSQISDRSLEFRAVEKPVPLCKECGHPFEDHYKSTKSHFSEAGTCWEWTGDDSICGCEEFVEAQGSDRFLGISLYKDPGWCPVKFEALRMGDTFRFADDAEVAYRVTGKPVPCDPPGNYSLVCERV